MSLSAFRVASPDSRSETSRQGVAAMPWADLSEGLSGLKQWSEPVIYGSAHRRLPQTDHRPRACPQSDPSPRPGLARPHPRGDMAEFEDMRETLVGALDPCSLTLDHLAE